jgi:hypothetical protein
VNSKALQTRINNNSLNIPMDMREGPATVLFKAKIQKVLNIKVLKQWREQKRCGIYDNVA